MSSDNNFFQWWSFGGLNEVGMNSMVFQFGDTVIPVDAGILFADSNDFGVQALYPDYAPFLQKHRPRHWIITHGHEDHIGAVPALFSKCQRLGMAPPTVVAPPMAAALIREKLRDGQKNASLKGYVECLQVINPGEEIEIDDVKIRYIETRHSTPDACSLAFSAKVAGNPIRVIHTADFKLDEHEFEDGIKTAEIYNCFGGEAADILFIDSTNAEREGHSVSEKEILPNLEKLIREGKERVYVTMFSSNVYRVASLINIARKCGREVCLAGRSLQGVYKLAGELGLLGRTCPDSSQVALLDTSEINRRPRERQFIICSGSQGEDRSVLTRLSQNKHAELQLEAGDRVIFSSKTIPGNEKTVSRLLNGLLRQRAEVFWSEISLLSAGGPIHASGHGRRAEIRKVIEASRARAVVPLHGELRQRLTCAGLARECGAGWGLNLERTPVVENNEALKFVFSGGRWEVAERVPMEMVNKILRFENFAAPSRDFFLKVRKQAAVGGVVAAVLDSYGKSRVNVKGLLPESLMFDVAEIERWMSAQYKTLKGSRAFDEPDVELETELAEELARFIRRRCGIRPFTFLHLVSSL